METYIHTLKKYAVFSGRATRKEYWTFFLINLAIAFVLGFIEGFLDLFPNSTTSIFARVFQLAVLLPGIAVGIRRMHDTNHSGWWLLAPFVNFYFAVQPGTPGDNPYGPDPQATGQTR